MQLIDDEYERGVYHIRRQTTTVYATRTSLLDPTYCIEGLCYVLLFYVEAVEH